MTSISPPQFVVGQRVWIYNVNARKGAGPTEGAVSKVGRKLVTVKADWYEKVFRIEDGRANDNYGHEWIKTDEQKADAERRSTAVRVLSDAGITLAPRARFTTEQLEALAETLTAMTS